MSRNGFALLSLARAVSVCVSFLTVALVARLLTPDEIGVYGVAASLIGLVQAFRDFGVGTYLVQERELDKEKSSAASGVALAFGTLTGCCAGIAAWPLSRLYGDDRLVVILLLLAVSAPVVSVNAVLFGHLRRALDFRMSCVLMVLGAVSLAGATLACAIHGLGAASMAWGTLASNVIVTVAGAVLRPQYVWVTPSLRRSRTAFSAGLENTLLSLVVQAGFWGPDLIMGKLLSFEQVGLYSRGCGPLRILHDMIVGPLGAVLMPTVASLRRHEDQVRILLLNAHEVGSGVLWPAYAFTALLSGPIIRVAFGEQWSGSAEIVPPVALAYALYFHAALAAGVMSGLAARRAAIVREAIIHASGLCFVVVGCRFGITGVAWAQVATGVLALAVNQHFLSRAIGLKWGELWQTCWRSVAVTLVASAPAFIASRQRVGGFEDSLAVLLVATPATALVWIVSLVLLRHPLRNELLRLFQFARRRLFFKP